MIVSYAQNFEDVILWRALGHVERGFYIDVGAHHPVVDSVSLAFYNKGWRGLHAEPCPLAAAELRAARHDEEVCEAAVGARSDSATFYAIEGTGLSTCDARIAQQHALAGRSIKPVEVVSVPLAELLDRAGGREIHWLKIDVEGAESAVIGGWSPSPARPWVVVVEAVHPHQDPTQSLSWEPALLGLGYEFVYFDGVNRFYVSVAHSDLKKHFGHGPNVFDDFTLSGRSSAPFCSALLGELQASRQELETAREREAALVAQCDALQAERATTTGAVATLEARSRALRRRLYKQQVTRQRIELAHAQLQTECANLEAERARLHGWCRGAEAALAESVARANAHWDAVNRLTQELGAMRASLSWRLSAPLRGAKALVLRGRALLPRSLPAKTLDSVLDYVRRRSRLKKALLLLLGLIPGLRARLRTIASARALRQSHYRIAAELPAPQANDTMAALPRRARQIYRELQVVRVRMPEGALSCD